MAHGPCLTYGLFSYSLWGKNDFKVFKGLQNKPKQTKHTKEGFFKKDSVKQTEAWGIYSMSLYGKKKKVCQFLFSTSSAYRTRKNISWVMMNLYEYLQFNSSLTSFSWLSPICNSLLPMRTRFQIQIIYLLICSFPLYVPIGFRNPTINKSTDSSSRLLFVVLRIYPTRTVQARYCVQKLLN